MISLNMKQHQLWFLSEKNNFRKHFDHDVNIANNSDSALQNEQDCLFIEGIPAANVFIYPGVILTFI